MTKRACDIVLAAAGLLALLPALLVVAVLVRLEGRGGVLFRQERIGKDFRPFWIYKFRTMVPEAQRRGAPITVGDDPRITRLGRVLRWTKFDELPQLVNVLRGEMSVVGPRPEVRRYVEMFREEYADILRIRPGITDLASIRFHDEAAVLGRAPNPEDEYVGRILPEKIRLAKDYVRRSSLALDLLLIAKTMGKLITSRASETPGATPDGGSPAGGRRRS